MNAAFSNCSILFYNLIDKNKVSQFQKVQTVLKLITDTCVLTLITKVLLVYKIMLCGMYTVYVHSRVDFSFSYWAKSNRAEV